MKVTQSQNKISMNSFHMYSSLFKQHTFLVSFINLFIEKSEKIAVAKTDPYSKVCCNNFFSSKALGTKVCFVSFHLDIRQHFKGFILQISKNYEFDWK